MQLLNASPKKVSQVRKSNHTNISSALTFAILVVIAAGNDGLNGAYTVLAPAKDATLVGSFDNNNFYTNYFIDQNNTFYRK